MTRPTALRIVSSRFSLAFFFAAGLSSTYYLGLREAHAEAAAVTQGAVAAFPPTSGLDVTVILAVLGVVLGGLSLLLSGASIIMHAIAARTKNTVDDAVADGIDKFRDEVVKVLGVLSVKDPATANVAVAVIPPVSLPKAPQSGRVLLTVLAVLAIGGVIGLATLQTAGCTQVKAAETAIVDCTKANQASIEALILEFRTLLQGDLPNWSAVESKAIAAGETIGGCALAQVVAGIAGNRSALDRDTMAKSTLEDFRARYAGGATFHTASGDL